ncbi:MAG: branched-chain amino acid ABC transporter permease [Dehalococcoidia bacterium]
MGSLSQRARVPSLAWLGVALLLIVVPPWMAGGYRLFQFTFVVIYLIAILGLNIVTGYNGQFSLGHGAFYAVGAYVTGGLMYHAGTPYWATIPLAGLTAGVIGFLFAIPALRLSGLYLALATLALAISVPQILKKWESVTGGVQGLVLTRPHSPIGALTSDQWLFYFTGVVALVLYIAAWILLRSSVGRAFVAIRDNEVAAEAAGIPIARYKTLAFGISAFYAGIAGSLSAFVVAYVAPDSFDFLLSLNLVVGMVVGGAGTILGPALGAVFIEFLPSYSQDISKAAPGVVEGVVLVLFMYLMPTGVAGFLRIAGGKALSLVRARPASGERPAEVAPKLADEEPRAGPGEGG